PVPSVQAEATCPVCLELFSEPVITECGHNFCGRCLAAVLGTPPRPADEARRPRCPRHGEALTLFCESCRGPLCPRCREESPHRHHRARPAEEAARELRVGAGRDGGPGERGGSLPRWGVGGEPLGAQVGGSSQGRGWGPPGATKVGVPSGQGLGSPPWVGVPSGCGSGSPPGRGWGPLHGSGSPLARRRKEKRWPAGVSLSVRTPCSCTYPPVSAGVSHLSLSLYIFI
uniref:Uncharacterized protein n=1 Tax=Strix occidentalis caurina TaxID=311401 RepID=A0A8D0KZ36_STROC